MFNYIMLSTTASGAQQRSHYVKEREMVEEYQEEGGNGVVGTGVDNVGRAHMTWERDRK